MSRAKRAIVRVGMIGNGVGGEALVGVSMQDSRAPEFHKKPVMWGFWQANSIG